ncbi:putative FKBP-type peptidyl-prolyl cis-trans isomerase [Dissostichus eleginoides]|uniref:FKBP-type peptidyl-prolyl cis-trans isomerase n=1 Tax=Dissostichus eleginoides TaxID=100907 RepID=A0AAD9BN48_DISEL|nr:putative FKBP-type peptidyl-prolyl cis-trans isomerase [Dissostichus eleginoides]
MFLSGNMNITVKLRDNTVDLKETKDLFARLMVLARSNRDSNQKEAIGNYEFTLTPRALFASNGTILPCHDKSKLINLLEKLTREDVPHEDHQLPQAGKSLKSATRDKRRQGKAIQYQVRDDTNIKHIPLSRFLSHDQTKADLTEYLAAKILEYNRGSSKLIITSASGNTRSIKDLLFEENNHEEADTLLIHQAVLASHRNPADAVDVLFTRYRHSSASHSKL